MNLIKRNKILDMKIETIKNLINGNDYEWFLSPVKEIYYHPEDIHLSLELVDISLVDENDFASSGIMVNIRNAIQNAGFKICLIKTVSAQIKYDYRVLYSRDLFIFVDSGGNEIFFPISLKYNIHDYDELSLMLVKQFNSVHLYSNYIYDHFEK